MRPSGIGEPAAGGGAPDSISLFPCRFGSVEGCFSSKLARYSVMTLCPLCRSVMHFMLMPRPVGLGRRDVAVVVGRAYRNKKA